MQPASAARYPGRSIAGLRGSPRRRINTRLDIAIRFAASEVHLDAGGNDLVSRVVIRIVGIDVADQPFQSEGDFARRFLARPEGALGGDFERIAAIAAAVARYRESLQVVASEIVSMEFAGARCFRVARARSPE